MTTAGRKNIKNTVHDHRMESDGQPPSLNDPVRESFLTRPLGGLILKNALPAVTSMLFLTAYYVADAIMVGRTLGPEALASVFILYPI